MLSLRRLFSHLAAVSLFFCLVTCALWVSTYWRSDELRYRHTNSLEWLRTSKGIWRLAFWNRNVERSQSHAMSNPIAFHPPIRTLSGMPPISQTIEIRVRYPEVDAMGYLHHSRYLQYFEMGRIELLRSLGRSYADLEREGIFFVVAKAELRYRAPSQYDQLLKLTTTVVRQTHVRIDHSYELRRDDKLLAEGSTTIACVSRDGQLQEIPDFLQNRPHKM